MEVTGTASPTGVVVHDIPGSQVDTGTAVPLPWKRGYVIDKEEAKVTGKDGEPVKCQATIKKMKV